MKERILKVDMIDWLIIDNKATRIEAREYRYFDKETNELVDVIYALDNCTDNKKSGLWDVARLVETSDFKEFTEKTKDIVGAEDFNKYWKQNNKEKLN